MCWVSSICPMQWWTQKHSEPRGFPRFSLCLTPCLPLGTLPFSKHRRPIADTHRATFHVPQGYNHLTTNLGAGKQTCPAACIQHRNLLLFPVSSTGEKRAIACILTFLRRLAGVMPDQMSWRYDMLTLMFNKAHLLQNLEASHIPPRLFYYYYFFLNLPGLIFFKKGNTSALFLRIKLTWAPCAYSLISVHQHGW